MTKLDYYNIDNKLINLHTLLSSFISSSTFCAIWTWALDNFSEDVFKNCHSGAKDPWAHPFAATFANFPNALEWDSSADDLNLKEILFGKYSHLSIKDYL